MAVSTRKAKAALLLAELEDALSKNGAALDVNFGLLLEPRSHTQEEICAIGNALLVSSRGVTARLNMALGAWWSALYTGAYGERSYLLRKIIHSPDVAGIQQRLTNYSCIYNRWKDAGLQPGKSWTWHREHGLDSSGNAVRCVPSAAAKKLVLDLSLRLYHEGTDDVRRLWFAACEALEGLVDDDTDEFEEI